MTGRQLWKSNGLALLVASGLFAIFPRTVVSIIFSLSTSTPGLAGYGLRYLCVSRLARRCGKAAKIGPGTTFVGLDRTTFGDKVSINKNCYIDGRGGLEIGSNVSIAHHTTILTFEHSWEDSRSPIKYCKLKFSPVRISSNVWVGCGVRVLAGAIVSSRSVIAANAVILRGWRPPGLYGGVPGKRLKSL